MQLRAVSQLAKDTGGWANKHVSAEKLLAGHYCDSQGHSVAACAYIV